MKKTNAIILSALLLGITGCSVLTTPVDPPPEPPSVEEVDLNQDGTVSLEEQATADANYEAALEQWKEQSEVKPNPAVEAAIGLGGQIATVFLGPVGSGVSTLLAGALGWAARTQNRRRKAERDQSGKVGRVMVDSMKDAFNVLEKTEIGQEGVAKLKDVLRRKQLNAGVWEDVKKANQQSLVQARTRRSRDLVPTRTPPPRAPFFLSENLTLARYMGYSVKGWK